MTTNEMRKLLHKVDNDKVAELITEMLTDTNVTTYDMFEDLVIAYDNGNASFREGMDKALETLLWYNMNDIAKKVKEDCLNN